MTKFYIAGHTLIQRKDKYLLTRRSSNNDYKPMKWDIPGGTVEPGETIEDAIIREVKEETNIKIKIKNVLYIYTNFDNYPDRQTFQIIYLSTYLSGDVILNIKEHDSYKWADYKEIYKLDTIEFLKSYIERFL